MYCAEVLAIAPDPPSDHYQGIQDRNAFALKPPPAINNPPPPPPSLPKLILTGITTILGNKRALLKALPLNTPPGQTAKEESLILTEGQRQGNVEVLNIDENAGSVRVNNSGTVMTLTFEKDGAKLTNTPPVLPSPTNANLVPPALLPTALPNRAAGLNPKPRSLPAREMRSQGVLGPSQTSVPNQTGAIGAVPAVPNPAAIAPLPQDLTPDEQAIVLELQRQSGGPPAVVSPATPQPGAPTVPGGVIPNVQTPVLPQ